MNMNHVDKHQWQHQRSRTYIDECCVEYYYFFVYGVMIGQKNNSDLSYVRNKEFATVI
jgi:hypothetical protein